MQIRRSCSGWPHKNVLGRLDASAAIETKPLSAKPWDWRCCPSRAGAALLGAMGIVCRDSLVLVGLGAGLGLGLAFLAMKPLELFLVPG